MNRPYVILNCAMSADGKIALPTKKQLRISSDEDIKRMYQLRNENDAVLVGINTILSDDPKLTVKEQYVDHVHQPLRIILDAYCQTPESALAVNTDAKTLIITGKKCNKTFGDHVEILQCEMDKHGLIQLNKLLPLLYTRRIHTLMVEGGSTVLWNFLQQKFVDDLFVYVGPMVIGGKETPTLADGKGIQHAEDLVSLKIVDVRRLGVGILIHYKMIP
jgi:2,5-diamino-6-(ribosylamino)-4(3H)-pyrimidinone 5'-phosphate reductase